jgi:hypothetical protein
MWIGSVLDFATGCAAASRDDALRKKCAENYFDLQNVQTFLAQLRGSIREFRIAHYDRCADFAHLCIWPELGRLKKISD